MNKPAPSIPYAQLSLVSETLIKFESAAYRNETVIDLLRSEKERLRQEWHSVENELSEWEQAKEQAEIDAQNAAKKERMNGYLSRMSNKDSEKALDLIDKLNKLKPGTVIYDEYEIELTRLLRFYDSI